MPEKKNPFTNPDPMPDVSRFRMHLDRAAVDQVCHYTHWIPNTRGFTKEFFARTYPSWSLASMMKVFQNSGILVKDGKGSEYGGRCHWKVRTIHFSSPEDFFVEWDTDAEDDGRFFWNGVREAQGTGSFVVKGDDIPFDDDEALESLARELIGRLGGGPAKDVGDGVANESGDDV